MQGLCSTAQDVKEQERGRGLPCGFQRGLFQGRVRDVRPGIGVVEGEGTNSQPIGKGVGRSTGWGLQHFNQ